MRFLYFFTVLLLLGNSLLAQNCLPSGITFGNQTDIDNFSTNYPGCTQIDGDIYITGSEVFNLLGLSNITTVGQDITIINCANLGNLQGLHNITSVGTDLFITNNDSLMNLSGLESLTLVPDGLRIFENDNLSNLTGLTNLDSVGAAFYVKNNATLLSFDGLDNINALGALWIQNNTLLSDISGLQTVTAIRDFYILDNPNLSSLDGLENITSIEFWLHIVNNESLTDLSGLQNISTIDGAVVFNDNTALVNFSNMNLTSVGERFEFTGHDLLSDFSGFDSLSSIGGELIISGNNSLSSISCFNDLQNAESVTINDNSNLSLCSSVGLCNLYLNGTSISLFNNAIGCNTIPEILYSCNHFGRINFPIFYDLNQNGVQDTAEGLLPNASVIILPAGDIALSNAVVGSNYYTDFGTHTIYFNPPSAPYWMLSSDSLSYTFNLTESNNADTAYFGLYPLVSISDNSTIITSPAFRCNEWVEFDIIAVNTGTTITDGTFWFKMDNEIIDLNYIDQPDIIINPLHVGWEFTDLYPGQSIIKKVAIHMPGPPDFPIGESLTFTTDIEYIDINGGHESIKYEYPGEIQCSFDPNDKLVNPVYPDNYALMGEDLVYTIRFQNTGNAEAYRVSIKDTLDANLNAATFQVINSSHLSVLSTTLDDDQYIHFEFNDIFLPDSTSDYEGSQGYVAYRIRAYEGLPEETVIQNTASIYFDFNPPVVTNTTENIMLSTFDFDEDGFTFFVDCDDTNAAINPDEIEIPYNGFDDDCNEFTLDDDLDQDGFGIADDCNDEDATINTAAVEIPNNGIDEDCDGEDLIVSNKVIAALEIQVFPNPTSGKFKILVSNLSEVNVEVRNCNGKRLLQNIFKQETELDLSDLTSGMYILLVQTEDSVWVERIIKQ